MENVSGTETLVVVQKTSQELTPCSPPMQTVFDKVDGVPVVWFRTPGNDALPLASEDILSLKYKGMEIKLAFKFKTLQAEVHDGDFSAADVALRVLLKTEIREVLGVSEPLIKEVLVLVACSSDKPHPFEDVIANESWPNNVHGKKWLCLSVSIFVVY
jgi:hypothetical protein